MIKVSIIVPCYNSEKYIRRCLDSLVNQTLKDIEIVLINDASTDATGDILREYLGGGGNVHIIDMPQNSRQGTARNIGMNIAKGKYITFVDSDDWVDLSMCEKAYNLAEKNNYEVVYFNALKVSDHTDHSQTNNHSTNIIKCAIDSKYYTVLGMYIGSHIQVWGSLYNREFLLKTEVKFPEKLYFEDGYFSCLIPYYIHNKDILNEVLYFYYENENSTVNSKNSLHYFDRLKIMNILLNDLKKHRFYDNNKLKIQNYFISYYIQSIKYLFNKFDEIPFDKVRELTNFILTNFPNYKETCFQPRNDNINFIITILELCEKNPETLYSLMQKNNKVKGALTLK